MWSIGHLLTEGLVPEDKSVLLVVDAVSRQTLATWPWGEHPDLAERALPELQEELDRLGPQQFCATYNLDRAEF